MKFISSLLVLASIFTAYSVFADEPGTIDQDEIARTLKNMNDLLLGARPISPIQNRQSADQGLDLSEKVNPDVIFNAKKSEIISNLSEDSDESSESAND